MGWYGVEIALCETCWGVRGFISSELDSGGGYGTNGYCTWAVLVVSGSASLCELASASKFCTYTVRSLCTGTAFM